MSRTVILDPTNERSPVARPRAPRLATLSGRSVALLDISKPRGDVFLERIEEHLRRAGARTVRFSKPTFARPAPADLRREIAVRCEAVIEALAD